MQQPTHVPPEVRDQIEKWLDLIERADIHRCGLASDVLEAVRLQDEERALEALVAVLAVQPASVRDGFRCMLTWVARNGPVSPKD